MAISVRDAITVLHGMLFGGLLLLTFTGSAVGLYVTTMTSFRPSSSQHRFLACYLGASALLAWIAVFLGAYAVYPWYRARPTAGVINLSGYPQRLLMSSPSTSAWHDIGMEWKEHIAWLAPITLTAVAYVYARYGSALLSHRSMRNALFGLLALGFFAASVAGFFGAMLNKFAPVRGGGQIVLMQGETHER